MKSNDIYSKFNMYILDDQYRNYDVPHEYDKMCVKFKQCPGTLKNTVHLKTTFRVKLHSEAYNSWSQTKTLW